MTRAAVASSLALISLTSDRRSAFSAWSITSIASMASFAACRAAGHGLASSLAAQAAIDTPS